VSQRRMRSCHGAPGFVSVQRGHRRSVQRLIEYFESALRRGGGGVLSALCDYACTVPARTGKGILPVMYGFTITRSEHTHPRMRVSVDSRGAGWRRRRRRRGRSAWRPAIYGCGTRPSLVLVPPVLGHFRDDAILKQHS
jgi:hypothetical protein